MRNLTQKQDCVVAFQKCWKIQMASKHHFAGPQMGSTKETCLPIPHPPPHPIKTLHSKDLWAVIHAKEHNIIILIHKMHPFNLDFCGVDRYWCSQFLAVVPISWPLEVYDVDWRGTVCALLLEGPFGLFGVSLFCPSGPHLLLAIPSPSKNDLVSLA